MLHQTNRHRELFEKVQFEMSSNADLIDYNLKNFNSFDDSSIMRFRGRLENIIHELNNILLQPFNITL